MRAPLTLIIAVIGLGAAIWSGPYAGAQEPAFAGSSDISLATPSLSLHDPIRDIADGNRRLETTGWGWKEEAGSREQTPNDTRLAVQDRTHEALGTSVEEPTGEHSDDPFYDPFAEKAPEDEVYDPWEPFNTTMFTFNRKVDEYVLKPVAEFYNALMPEFAQRGISNGFDNFRIAPKLANNLLQGKFKGAGIELSRFAINSTMGMAGFFDVAGEAFGLETPTEDLGQTFASYGADSGPYLILPLLPPLTVRDGVGYFGNNVMNPAWWLLPFSTLFFMTAGDTVNERSRNLELFEGVEASTVDLYGAVRNAYLQRRAKAIEE